jgi:hypothetical protein
MLEAISQKIAPLINTVRVHRGIIASGLALLSLISLNETYQRWHLWQSRDSFKLARAHAWTELSNYVHPDEKGIYRFKETIERQTMEKKLEGLVSVVPPALYFVRAQLKKCIKSLKTPFGEELNEEEILKLVRGSREWFTSRKEEIDRAAEEIKTWFSKMPEMAALNSSTSPPSYELISEYVKQFLSWIGEYPEEPRTFDFSPRAIEQSINIEKECALADPDLALAQLPLKELVKETSKMCYQMWMEIVYSSGASWRNSDCLNSLCHSLEEDNFTFKQFGAKPMLCALICGLGAAVLWQ